MSGHRPWWRELRAKLIRRAASAQSPAASADEYAVNLYLIAKIAGHRPSGLADLGGGDQCACRQASWSHLATFGPYGGCPAGWYDAREFLARYGVTSEADFEARRRHHQFGHRNGLTTFSHDNPLCRRYECVEATEEDR